MLWDELQTAPKKSRSTLKRYIFKERYDDNVCVLSKQAVLNLLVRRSLATERKHSWYRFVA